MSLLTALGRLSLVTSTLAAERLALSVFGAESRRPLASVLDTASEAASAELGEVTEVFYNAGDELVRSGLDLAAGLLRGDPETDSRLARGGGDLYTLGRPDRPGQLGRLEARNKLDIFWQVRRARTAHGARRDGRPFDLEPALERALGHTPAFRFWALEGLGHDFVKGYLEAGLTPRALLRHAAVRELADGDLAALHGGLGLAVADFIAGGLHRHAGTARFEASLARFVELCRENAAAETHAEVALEALGLVASVFHAPLRPGLERALPPRPRLSRLYWHGAGRGAYFSGSQLVPGYGSFARAVEKTAERAPDASSRQDAWSGLGYAFAMVSSEQPAVLAAGLRDLEPELEASSDLTIGLGTGIAGALAMQRLLGHPRRAARMLEQAAESMPIGLWTALLAEPDEQLRRQGREHGLYGALPWGAG